MLTWRKTEFFTEQEQTACTELKGTARRKAVGRKTTVFAAVCPSMKTSLLKVSVPDSSANSLKGLEPVILSAAGKICPWWRSVQMEAYEEHTPTLKLFFLMNICSLRIRRANITGSKGYFLDWYVAQYHILRCWEEKGQLWRYQRQLLGACFHDFYDQMYEIGYVIATWRLELPKPSLEKSQKQKINL